MKTILALSVALLSFHAFAFPAVGDKAEFDGTNSGVHATVTLELTAYDAVTEEYTQVATTTSDDGNRNVETTQVSAASLISTDQVNQILAYCEFFEGKLERVQVPAGEFDTCKLKSDDNLYNIGPVPFGIVKGLFNEQDGTQTTLELKSFKVAP